MIRGQRSRKYLEKIWVPCPKVYGEPGLLSPIFFSEYKIMAAISQRIEEQRTYVPNLYDLTKFRVIPDNVEVIYPTRDLGK